MDETEEFEFRHRYEQEQQQTPRLDTVESPSLIDTTALAADKILTNLGQALPDFLPSRQQIVDVAAGASEMGGLLRNAPRLENVATESGARTVGRLVDPMATLAGVKGFQAAQQLPKLGARLEAASPLMSRIRPMLDEVTGFVTKTPFRQSVVGGYGAGGAVGALHGVGEGDILTGAGEGALMGAALGGAVHPLAFLGGKVANMVADIRAGAEGQVIKYLHDVFGGDTSRVADTLRQLRGLVAGEAPTSGIGAVSGAENINALKALELQARARNPQMFNAADEATQLARAAPLEAMAYPGQRYYDAATGRVAPSVAESMRKQVTDPLYRLANPQEVALPESLIRSLEGAQAAPIVNRGERAIQQATGTSGTAEAVAPTPFNQFGTLESTPFMPQLPTRTIGELQTIKDELSKQIRALEKATDAPSLRLKNNLVDARDQLVKEMTSQSGEYAVANTLYRNFSAPQNQAQVAQELLNAIRSPAGVERLNTYLAAMRNAPRTITRAGGNPRFTNLNEMMTPEQMQSINAIKASAQREADFAALPATRESLPEMKSVFTTMEEVTPSFLQMAVAAVRKGLNLKGGARTQEATQILDRAVAEPQFMVKLLDSSLPKDRPSIANAIAKRAKELKGAGIAQVVNQQQ